ncbi:hypothetical protein H4R35_004566 [Dimargaris xerosporica]|nr:hypothetical protein H4R35_004566 [Dimargaris xerosporica]
MANYTVLKYILAIGFAVGVIHLLVSRNAIDRDAQTYQSEPIAADYDRVLQEPPALPNVVPAPPVEIVQAPPRKANACFVVLIRNKEVHDFRESMRQLEDRFNSKHNYPYVFLNNEPFTDEFKSYVTALTSANVSFGLIPEEHWSYPTWIDQNKAAETRERMKNVIYGSSESYRHMCRFESGFFFRHPLMESFDYYWRVEPGVKFLCDIDYDPFLFMQDHDIKYGFTITGKEIRSTVTTLWDTTKQFIREHRDMVAHPNTLGWIVKPRTGKYNMCHYWSNFEIASLKFLRSEKYLAYFDFLDKAGGFFYERWGDAPVHSIAAAMFLKKEEIHWFEDIGYRHGFAANCPLDPELNKKKCHCDPKDSIYFSGWSCTKEFIALDPLSNMDIDKFL